jgi:hypothetical protein
LQDGAKVENFKYLSKGKNICSTYHISITSLPEEVGTMQFRVQGEPIKNIIMKNKKK